MRHSHLVVVDDSDDDLSWYRSRVKKIRLF
jgi:hypothetical protein